MSCDHLPFYVIQYIDVSIIHAVYQDLNIDELWLAGTDLIDKRWWIHVHGIPGRVYIYRLKFQPEVTNLTFSGENCKNPPRILPSGRKVLCRLKIQAESCRTEILDWGCIYRLWQYKFKLAAVETGFVPMPDLFVSIALKAAWNFIFISWDETDASTALMKQQPWKDVVLFMKVKPSHAFLNPKATRRTLNWLKAAASRSDCSCAVTHTKQCIKTFAPRKVKRVEKL